MIHIKYFIHQRSHLLLGKAGINHKLVDTTTFLLMAPLGLFGGGLLQIFSAGGLGGGWNRGGCTSCPPLPDQDFQLLSECACKPLQFPVDMKYYDVIESDTSVPSIIQSIMVTILCRIIHINFLEHKKVTQLDGSHKHSHMLTCPYTCLNAHIRTHTHTKAQTE